MKVLFYYRGIESLGVEYLMSYLKSKGHQVELLFNPGLDDNLFLKAGFMRRFNQEKHLLEKAKQFDPDIMAFSIPTNVYSLFIETIAQYKRELSVPIIAGGPHISALPEYVLSNKDIDMVCIGEGEEAFAELLDKMEKRQDIYDTRNIWFKQNGQIIKNELRDLIGDLSELPFPDKQAFYRYGCFHDNLEVISARGCPFKCTFCNIHFQRELTKGKGQFVRKRAVPNVIAELKEHLSRYDIKYITFHDDTFTIQPEWVDEFCESYRKEINLPFYCFAYPTTVNREIMSKLKEANCMQIFMGMDSGDPDIRGSLLKRPMPDERIINSAAIIKESGIHLQTSAIFGFPGEKPDSMWKSVRLAERMEPDLVSGYVFYPLPQTELYKYAVEIGQLGAQEIEKVKRGEGSLHQGSVMKHPHKQLALTMSRLLPIYIKAPRFVRAGIRRIIEREYSGLALIIYVLSIPVAFPFLGMEGIKITLKMAWRSYRLRKRPLGSE